MERFQNAHASYNVTSHYIQRARVNYKLTIITFEYGMLWEAMIKNSLNDSSRPRAPIIEDFIEIFQIKL